VEPGKPCLYLIPDFETNDEAEGDPSREIYEAIFEGSSTSGIRGQAAPGRGAHLNSVFRKWFELRFYPSQTWWEKKITATELDEAFMGDLRTAWEWPGRIPLSNALDASACIDAHGNFRRQQTSASPISSLPSLEANGFKRSPVRASAPDRSRSGSGIASSQGARIALAWAAAWPDRNWPKWLGTACDRLRGQPVSSLVFSQFASGSPGCLRVEAALWSSCHERPGPSGQAPALRENPVRVGSKQGLIAQPNPALGIRPVTSRLISSCKPGTGHGKGSNGGGPIGQGGTKKG